MLLLIKRAEKKKIVYRIMKRREIMESGKVHQGKFGFSLKIIHFFFLGGDKKMYTAIYVNQWYDCAK